MARTQSRTKTAIWSNDDFRKLTGRAQRMYWMLYSQPTISLCGVIALTERRWASSAADETVDAVREALRELVERGYVMVDYDTEEAWIRTFIRHDGVGQTLSARTVAWGQLANIASPRLRRAAADALREFGPPPGDWNPPEGLEDYALDLPQHPQPTLMDRVYPTLPPTVDDRVGESVGGTSRTRTRAVSSLQSPSPVSLACLQDPPPPPQAADKTETGTQRCPETKPETTPGDQLALAHAVIAACHGQNRAVVRNEAAALVMWAAPVDPKLVEEAIGWAGQQPKPPDLPRALGPVIVRKARDRHLSLPPFQPPGVQL